MRMESIIPAQVFNELAVEPALSQDTGPIYSKQREPGRRERGEENAREQCNCVQRRRLRSVGRLKAIAPRELIRGRRHSKPLAQRARGSGAERERAADLYRRQIRRSTYTRGAARSDPSEEPRGAAAAAPEKGAS